MISYDSVIVRGRKCKPPRYYDKKWFDGRSQDVRDAYEVWMRGPERASQIQQMFHSPGALERLERSTNHDLSSKRRDWNG